jgi:tripartite-type tricarboxylate transporter receptor subunit TctC
MPARWEDDMAFGRTHDGAFIKATVRGGTTAVLTAALILAGAQSAQAQDAENFYRGKTITMVVGASVGGGVDLFARLVARHLGKFIPGAPQILVQNMPGAGSVVAAKHLYTLAPKDGTQMASVLPGAFFDPLFNPQPGDSKDKYDPTKFNFIGNGNAESLVCVARDDAPIMKNADMYEKEFIVGTPGGGSLVHVYTTVLKNLLGAKLKIVTGYPGTKEIVLAVQNGEVQGVCGFAYSSAKLNFPGAAEGKGGYRIIAQVGSVGYPELDKAGIPLTIDSAKDKATRDALEIFYSQGMYVRAFMMPPGVPKDRVEIVRKAFIQAIKSDALQEEAVKMMTDADPNTGADMQAMVEKVYAASPDVIETIKKAMAK